jgi:hypothetical protein
MAYERTIKASEMLYATRPATISDISMQTGLSETYVQKIKLGFELYLEEKLTPEEIATKAGLSTNAMKEIIRGFFSKCTVAYKHYQNQIVGSISGSAEAIGINRFCFEDWFWSKAIDSNDKDGRECLDNLIKELSCL